MKSITQDMRYRLLLIQWAEKFGVTKAAVKYKTNRQCIYRRKRHYDGSPKSYEDNWLQRIACEKKKANDRRKNKTKNKMHNMHL